LKKDNGRHAGLETPSSREGVPCHGTAQLKAGRSLLWAPHARAGTLEGLQPEMTRQAITHKAAETITQNSLNLLLPQSARRVKVDRLHVTSSENTNNGFISS